jgi:hypothetical protein
MGKEKLANRRGAFDIRLIFIGSLLLGSVGFFLMEKLHWLPFFQPSTHDALTHPDGTHFHPMWAYVLLWENFGNLIFIVLGAVLFFLLLVKSNKIPKLLSAYFLLGFAFILINNVVLRSFSPTAAMDQSRHMVALVVAALATSVVVPFMLKSSWAQNTFTTTSAGRRPRTIVLLLVLILFAYAVIGQTAYVIIYGVPTVDPRLTEIGVSPFAMGFLQTALWYACFLSALWAWMSKKARHGFGVGLAVGFAVFFAALAVPKAASDENIPEPPPPTQSWTQDELTEEYMRSLTKDQCMEKTISYLEACSSDQCLKNAAGISGDCIEFSEGNNEEFCSDYDSRYRQEYCGKDASSAICNLLSVLDEVICQEH